jgi:hypothetical protein
MMVLNIASVAIILTCIILRIYYYHSETKNPEIGAKDKPGMFVLFTIIFTFPFHVLSGVMILLAELKNQWVRLYFNFLDSKRGRGFFLLLITLTLFDDTIKGHGILIVLGILLLVIVFLNLVVGWGISSDNDKGLNWKS